MPLAPSAGRARWKRTRSPDQVIPCACTRLPTRCALRAHSAIWIATGICIIMSLASSPCRESGTRRRRASFRQHDGVSRDGPRRSRGRHARKWRRTNPVMRSPRCAKDTRGRSTPWAVTNPAASSTCSWPWRSVRRECETARPYTTGTSRVCGAARTSELRSWHRTRFQLGACVIEPRMQGIGKFHPLPRNPESPIPDDRSHPLNKLLREHTTRQPFQESVRADVKLDDYIVVAMLVQLDPCKQLLDPSNLDSVRVAHLPTDQITEEQFARHHLFSPCDPGM